MNNIATLIPEKLLFCKWLKIRRIKEFISWNAKYYPDDEFWLVYKLAKKMSFDLKLRG